MHSFEEAFQLLLDACGHFGVGNQLDVLELVFLSDQDVFAVGDELFGLHLPELVELIGEVELKIVLNGRVVEDPLETLEVLVVLFLHVLIGDRQV